MDWPLLSRLTVNKGALVLAACVVQRCEDEQVRRKPGYYWAALVRVLAALRGFLREVTPWRGLQASAEGPAGFIRLGGTDWAMAACAG